MDPITSYYFQQGVLGVTIIILAGVVVWQQRRLDQKDKDLKESLLLRLQDSKDYTGNYTGTVERYATLSEKSFNSDNLMMQAINGLAQYVRDKLK